MPRVSRTILLRRASGPSPERAGEVGVVGVPEVEREVEDLGVRLLEHGGRRRESGLGDENLVADAGRCEMALERTNCHADEFGGLPNVRVMFSAGQRLDRLSDG